MKEKLILLSQPVHRPIDEAEMLASVPPAEAAWPRRVVAVAGQDEAIEAVRTGDWSSARSVVEATYRESVKPVLDADGDALIRYFGAVPIPMAMLLGSLVGSWHKVTPHLLHHERKDWRWDDSSAARPTLRSRGLRSEPSRAEGDVIVRVVTSVAIDVQSTLAICATPIAEYDLELEPAGLDAVDRLDVLEEVADAFRAVMDDIGGNLPNARVVHVFASVPVGLAFLMGARLSPTMHPPLQTYYYDQKAEPRQRPAILLLARESSEEAPLTEEERANAAVVRSLWAAEAGKLKDFAVYAKSRVGATWSAEVLPLPESRGPLTHRWLELPAVHETVLVDSTVDIDHGDVNGEFDFVWKEKRWQFDDRLASAVGTRLSTEELRARAGRMLMLHEAVHLARHLTRQMSREVGRFPKLLEQLDYQADVWAMLHEFAFSEQRGLTRAPEAVKFFLGLIDVALETFWAFDQGLGQLRRIQVRRLHRYLLWYWQHLRIERLTDLNDVVRVLADQPMIELAGPRLEAERQRVFFDLDARRMESPEIAVVYESRLYRYASGPASDVRALIDGFRSRNGALVKDSLAGIFAQVVR